jgi:hypothetical protein
MDPSWVIDPTFSWRNPRNPQNFRLQNPRNPTISGAGETPNISAISLTYPDELRFFPLAFPTVSFQVFHIFILLKIIGIPSSIVV